MNTLFHGAFPLTLSTESWLLYMRLQRLSNPEVGESPVEWALFSDTDVYSIDVSDRST